MTTNVTGQQEVGTRRATNVAPPLPQRGARRLMNKVMLSDRFVHSPKRVPKVGRRDFHDALVPDLALRVTSSGHRSFVLIARYPARPEYPARHALGGPAR